jgi:hypothetical protein
MTANTKNDFVAEYARLKKERDKKHEERVRCEAELQTAESQLADVDKKIKSELGIEPSQLESSIKELEIKCQQLVKEIEELLKTVE